MRTAQFALGLDLFTCFLELSPEPGWAKAKFGAGSFLTPIDTSLNEEAWKALDRARCCGKKLVPGNAATFLADVQLFVALGWSAMAATNLMPAIVPLTAEQVRSAWEHPSSEVIVTALKQRMPGIALPRKDDKAGFTGDYYIDALVKAFQAGVITSIGHFRW